MSFSTCNKCGMSVYKGHHPNCPVDRIAELEQREAKLKGEVMAEAVAICNLTTPHDESLRSVATRLVALFLADGLRSANVAIAKEVGDE